MKYTASGSNTPEKNIQGANLVTPNQLRATIAE
jgi:hypothetical protein